jgi:hypothetical protein
MGDADPLARAREAAADAEQTFSFGAVHSEHLVAVQAFATLAVAEALTALVPALTSRPAATRTDGVTAHLFAFDQDALGREAAARIDAIAADGQAGPYVRAASNLGLNYAKHWPTLVAVEVVLNEIANQARVAHEEHTAAITATVGTDTIRGYL